MKYLFLSILVFFIFSCSNEECRYDTDCDNNLICTFSKCVEPSIECETDTDCLEPNNRCGDGTPCRCNEEVNICFTYDPCRKNPCTEENRGSCIITDNKDFFTCECDEQYYLEDDICKYDCSDTENTHTNTTNNGCSCNDGYYPENDICTFDCREFSLRVTNITNDGCICIDGYEEIDGGCSFICNDNNSHINNENNGCSCNLGYYLEEEICKYDCRYDQFSHSNIDNDSCECNDGYSLKNGMCSYSCGDNSHVNSSNSGCICDIGFEEIDGSCVDIDECLGNPCQNGGICIDGINSYSCDCLEDTSGDNCEITRDRTTFITKWKTDNEGSSADNQIRIPIYDGATYNYNIDCDNDGTLEAVNQTGSYTCTYPEAGIYSVAISGTFPGIRFYNSGENKKIISIEQWGDIEWRFMSSAFFGCSNLAGQASDSPDLSNVDNLAFMFREATSFNQDIGDWDISNVTNIMGMFYYAHSFNQDISGWDTSNITNMSHLFQAVYSFNQDISGWDTSKVEDMSAIFHHASSFNQDISGWDTSKVTAMSWLFYGATSFNQDISGWDVSKVTAMNYMFREATSFDQDLSSWDISLVTDMTFMFEGMALSRSNYDALLMGWSHLNLRLGVNFNGGDSTYCLGESARESIISTYSWVVLDAGKNCN